MLLVSSLLVRFLRAWASSSSSSSSLLDLTASSAISLHCFSHTHIRGCLQTCLYCLIKLACSWLWKLCLPVLLWTCKGAKTQAFLCRKDCKNLIFTYVHSPRTHRLTHDTRPPEVKKGIEWKKREQQGLEFEILLSWLFPCVPKKCTKKACSSMLVQKKSPNLCEPGLRARWASW